MKKGITASFASTFAALCCAGTPILLAFLSGIGLGFLINDLILFPILFISLGFMYYSLNHNKKKHLSQKPIYTAIISTILILVGIFVSQIIWFGVIGLFVSTIWDYTLIRNLKVAR